MEEETLLFQRYLEELDREQMFYETLEWEVTQLYHRIQEHLSNIEQRKVQVQSLINHTLEAYLIYKR